MALKHFEINFYDLSKENTFRNDVDYVYLQKNYFNNYTKFDQLFKIENENKLKADELNDEFYYVEIGNVSQDGEVDPICLNFNSRTDEKENYYKKIEQGDIIKVSETDILISKIRPNLKKFILIDNTNVNYFYTSAFIHLKPIKSNKIFYYLLRTKFLNNIIAISRQVKGYPTINSNDMYNLKFDTNIINNIIANEYKILSQIEPIEKNIKNLKSQIKLLSEIINEVFANYFGFDIKNKYRENKKFVHFVTLEEVANNEDLKLNISLKYKNIINYMKNNPKINWIIIDKIVDIKGGKRLPKGQNIIDEFTKYKYVR